MKFSLLISIPLAGLLLSCANQTTPEGGPKDEKPPDLLSSNPKNNQTSFDGNSIELNFSEAIRLNNPKEEIIIVPPVGKKTNFVAKKNKLIIEPEEKWKDSTTYTINFREGVEDITEGNPAPDLHLAFSTGEYIDSLQIEGTVKEALKETIPEKITVAIYEADTFDIFEHTPNYFTKSNKEGKFKITNLKPGTYHIYAFEDKNKNLKVESKSEKFGFVSKPIQLSKDTSKIEIALVNIDSRQLALTSVRNQSVVNTIRLNKPVVDYSILAENHILSTFGSTQSEVIAYYPPIEEDSLAISFQATDSLDRKIDSLLYIKRDDNEKIKETFKPSFREPVLNLETREFTFSGSFNKPLTSILYDSIFIELDTISTVPIKKESILIDTIRNKLEIKEKILSLPDSLPRQIQLRLGTAFLISIDSDSSKTETKKIKTLNSETTGVLLVEIETNETNFIVQVINNSGEIIQSSVNQKNATFKYLNPESFKIRLVIDSNGNGVWDSSNYFTRTEPEQVIYYQALDKKFDVPLRANWEVGPLKIKF